MDKNRNIEAIYPLSPTQEGLLFHTLYAPGSGVYYEQVSCTFRQGLNVASFKRAWQTVADRHAALRTLFKWDHRTRPLQVVLRGVQVPWREEDWRNLTPAGQREALERLMEEERAPGFVLDRAPLMRCGLFRTGEDRYSFVWSYHHLLVDGWSVPLLLKEVFSFYGAYQTGRDLALPVPPPYQDYIEWLQKQDLGAAEAFWRRRLQGFTAPTPLVVDHAADDLSPGGHGVCERLLSSPFTTRLNALARSMRVTLNTLVQGAWALLLSRYSGEPDVVFGATVSGRPPSLPGVEGMVGLFINALPTRVRIADDLPLAAWLRELHGRHVEAEAYSYTPLVSLQGWSEVPREVGLFDSLIIFENYPIDGSLAESRESLGIQDIRIFQLTNYPLTLVVLPEDELCLRVHYDLRRFEQEVAERVAGHLSQILEELVRHAEGRIRDVSLLTSPERMQLLAPSGTPARSSAVSGECLHRIFEAQARRAPEAEAATFRGDSVSYGELNARANRLAHLLIAHGVGPEVRVGLCAERSLEMVVGILAVLKAGGAYVPLDPAYPAERLAWTLSDSRAAVLLTQAHLLDRLPGGHGAPVVLLETEGPDAPFGPVLDPEVEVGAANLCYVIYTSGSTGRPKGVCVEHRQVAHLFASTRPLFGFGATDVWSLFHSFAFDFSVWELWGALLHGGRVVVVPQDVSRSPRELCVLLVAEGVTVLSQTPSAFRQLVQDTAWDDLRELRSVVFGGEALDPACLRAWVARHGDESPALVNMYGITETTVHVTHRRVCAADLASARTPIGGPIPGLDLYLLDPRLEPVPEGVPGEVHVGGYGLARGYLGRPDLTAERFIPHPFADEPGARLYRSGDLARHRGGEVEYLGRLDSQVKVRGFRIEPGEIEAEMAAHPAVHEAVVTVQEDADGHRKLVAYVTPAEEVDLTALRHDLRRRLPAHMVPGLIMVLEALPRTASGKLDRRALPAPLLQRQDPALAYVAPRTRAEADLAAIWAEALGHERVGVTDNFFDLGGDSIKSIQVLSRSRRAGLDFTLNQLFEARTVERLAQLMIPWTEDGLPGEALGTVTLIREEDRARLPEDIEDAYPMASLQAGMLSYSRGTEEAPKYHVINTFHLRAPFHRPALEATLEALAARHAALRTSFHLTAFSEPLQLVHREVRVPLAVEDLSALPGAVQEERIAAFLESERHTPFDWTRPPLLRLHVHLRSDASFQLSVVEHHAILDGWSSATLTAELFSGYLEAMGLARPETEPMPPIRFREFVALERLTLQWEDCQRYWERQLARRPPCLLPHRSQGRDTVTAKGSLEIPLSPEIDAGLRRLAKEADVPLKSVLLAAHLHALCLETGQLEVTSGVVFNGRPESPGAERVLGLFLNTLPLGVELRPGETWTGLVARTFAAERDILPYRRLPLAEIQRRFGRLFDALFNFTHFHVLQTVPSIEEVEVLSAHTLARTNLPFIAEFGVDPLTSRIWLRLDYDAARFPEAQIASLGAGYARALGAMAARPGGVYEVPAGDNRSHRAAETAVDPGPAAGTPLVEMTGPSASKADSAAPRTELEATLAGMWAEVLERDSVGVDEDFFDLGGDSLVMIRLWAMIEERLDRAVPMEGLLGHATVRAQAALLGGAGPERGPASGGAAPLFFVPGAGGHVLYLRELARALGPDRPFYALQARGLDGLTEPHRTVEEAATCYLEAIERVQPEGPYFLGGHSFGGWVAFEMARRLAARGQKVALLAIVDSRAPLPEHQPVSEGWDEARWTEEIGGILERFFGIGIDTAGAPSVSESRIERLGRQLLAAGVLAPPLDLQHIQGFLEVFRAHHRTRYTPPADYAQPITLLRARDIHADEAQHADLLARADLGWGSLSTEPIRRHVLPGDHVSMMRQPDVQALADLLRRMLQPFPQDGPPLSAQPDLTCHI